MTEQESESSVKVAAVQMEPRINDKEGNISKAMAAIDEATNAGARLVVFPECALTAYAFADSEETSRAAESVPGPATEKLAQKARGKGVYIAAGLVESQESFFYNTAVLVGPEGFIGKYRKIHPWYPAEEKWPVTPVKTHRDSRYSTPGLARSVCVSV